MAEPLILGVTGTREHLTQIQETSGLRLLRDRRDRGIIWQHNGDCIGADHFAARTWRRMGGLIFGHPPSDNKGRAYFAFDKAALPAPYGVRDQTIVDWADTMIAFPKTMQEEQRSGTWMTVRMARRKGISISFVWPNGEITTEGRTQ